MEKMKDRIRLTDIGNDNLFRVPDGYFDKLEDQIMNAIEAQEPKRKGFLFYLKPAIGIAASFALVFLLVYPIKNMNKKVAKDNSNTEVSVDEYILAHFSSNNELIEMLGNEEVNERITDYEIETVLLASMSEFDLMITN